MERFCITTYVARAEGRRLLVTCPGPETYVSEFSSDERAKSAALYLREHGVDCNQAALDRVVKNF